MMLVLYWYIVTAKEPTWLLLMIAFRDFKLRTTCTSCADMRQPMHET